MHVIVSKITVCLMLITFYMDVSSFQGDVKVPWVKSYRMNFGLIHKHGQTNLRGGGRGHFCSFSSHLFCGGLYWLQYQRVPLL